MTAEIGRFVVVPAAYVFLLRPAPTPSGREVLLQLRSGTGYMDDHWAAAVAGHVERYETVFAAAAREALEETGHRFEPEQVVGFYLWHSREADTTYLRVAFCGTVEPSADVAALDEGVVAVHWLTRAQLVSRAHQLRSPMVMRCIDDYIKGQRYPLDCLTWLESKTVNLDDTATLLVGC